jgi:hypothetical protein
MSILDSLAEALMRRTPQDPSRDFEEFLAVELFCSTCGTARPVRKRLLLALLDGERYDYICSVCGNVVGQQDDKGGAPSSIILP